ncbi:MAG: DJ-1/PfpI family protein [Metamycoplasmataceae bacterium]
MNMKILTLILCGYQDIELSGVIGTLDKSGELDVTYYNPNGDTNIFGSFNIGSIKTISTYNINDYDGIFIPGGRAALELRKNEKALTVIKDFIKNDKYIIAICDAPNALYETKLITDKKYVSYPIDGIDSRASSLRQKNDSVIVDGKYITGRGPAASIELGLKTLEVMISKEKSDKVRAMLFA